MRDLHAAREPVRLEDMDPMSPIQGISLQRYAELSAEVTDVIHEPDACARIVEGLGVSRADWEAAHQGWVARMQDMSLMGSVATAYMPLYQAALAKKRGTIDVSFEDFVALSAAQKAWGRERTLQHYQIDDAAWSQIASTWTTQRIPQDMGRYGMYGMLVEQEAQRLAQGGAPKNVQFAKSAGYTGGSGPSQPTTPAGQQAYQAQQVENQMMAQAVQQNVAAHMAAAQAQAAAAYGQAAQNVGFMGRAALGAVGYGAIANGVGPGMGVLVQWSDGNRYPATVSQVGGGQVHVTFTDGRQMWVPAHAVTPR